MSSDPPKEFLDRAASIGLVFDPDDLDRFSDFLQQLLNVNQQFNLTAITEPATAWMRHILDSLTLIPLLMSLDAHDVADVGSGGGLPGIPLAIALPDIRFTLIEATGKKAQFLEQVRHRLNLTNVRVINERAETIGREQEHRDRYDAVIARAVGRLPVLLELTVPLARVGGFVLAMKGAQARTEIEESKQALHLLHAHVLDVCDTGTGVVVLVQKHRPTPRAYPRPPGEPKRSPLGLKTSPE